MMEGKWQGHFSENLTENWGLGFEGVRSFRLVRTKRDIAYHLPISQFLLGSRFTLYKFAPFLDLNRNGCGNSAVNCKIAYHYAFDTPTGFFCQMVSTPGKRFCMDLPKNVSSLGGGCSGFMIILLSVKKGNQWHFFLKFTAFSSHRLYFFWPAPGGSNLKRPKMRLSGVMGTLGLTES